MPNVHPFFLSNPSTNAHINASTNLSMNVEPQLEIMVPIFFIPDIEPRIQQEILSLIHNVSKNSTQPTTLQYLIHQEAQVDNLIQTINIEDIVTQD